MIHEIILVLLILGNVRILRQYTLHRVTKVVADHGFEFSGE